MEMLGNNSQQICKNKKFTMFLNFIFALSSAFLMLFMYQPYNSSSICANDIYFEISWALLTVLICLLFLKFSKFDIWNYIFPMDAFRVILSCLVALTFVVAIEDWSLVSDNLKIAVIVCSAFSVFVYSALLVSLFLNVIKSLRNSFDKTEKRIFITYVIVGFCVGLILLFFTSEFILPHKNCDSVFSFDTGRIVGVKLNVMLEENDCRHFLMSLAMYPFLVVPYFFFRITQQTIVYSLAFLLVQMVLMAYSVISIIKLIGIKDSKQKVIYALLLSFCAGFLFNGLIVEKYVIATFYIIATLKLCEEKNNLKWLTCIGAMGMLTTSVVFVPVVLLYDSKRNIKKFFKEGVLVALLFLCVMIVSGQFNLLFRNTSYVMAKKFSSVDSDITMPDKLLQTLAFFANVLFCPSFNVFSDGSVFQTPCQFGVYTFLGMIIIILLMLNAVFNRNNKFSLICAYWNFMIIIFLFGFGWGSVLDEMFIYSLIFGFTILSSLIILFESIKINSKIKLSVQVLILVMLFTFNVFKLCEITYYLSKVVI